MLVGAMLDDAAPKDLLGKQSGRRQRDRGGSGDRPLVKYPSRPQRLAWALGSPSGGAAAI